MNVVTELLELTKKLKPRIIAIAECPLENGDWLHLEGFTCYAETTPRKYGCAVYIKNEYVHMYVVERITSQYITLWTAGTEVTFAYQRPQAKNFDQDNKWHRNNQNIIIGDLNAKHPSWSAGQANVAGNYLYKWINERNLTINNPHTVTHPPTGSHPIGTTLDLVISNQELNLEVQHLTIPSGDHLALAVKTPIKWTSSSEQPLRYDKANWGMIRAELLLMDASDHDPTRVQRKLTDIVLKHTPRARHKAKAFWNQELDKNRSTLREMIKKDPLDPNIIIVRRAYRKSIARSKMEANGKALQEESDPQCFRSVRARQTRHPIPALLKADGHTAAEHQHIAQEFQDALYLGEHQRTKTEIRATAEPLNIGILNAAIKQSPNGASPGPDFITTRLIKEFCEVREDLFLATMSQAWEYGIPATWKNSNTILIPKARKPTYTAAKSWRPIQLQSILAKVLERAAVQRIANLELLEPNMFGGRKKNGTTDAIQALNDAVTNEYAPYTCLTTLDIEGGFDNLRIDDVCRTIAQKSNHLAQWVRHWATDRTTSYRFNGKSSRAFATDKGTPQGSPLSPILFLISIKKIAGLTIHPVSGTRTRIITYVDDILISTAFKQQEQGQEAHQDILHRLTQEARQLGYTFAPSKAECLHIKTPLNKELKPRLGNHEICKVEGPMRWLGYFITSDYKWDQHIATWTKKAMQTGYNLKALTSRYQTGGLNTWTTLRLIKGLIMPQLTYGIEVWKTKKPIREAQGVLNNIIRKTFGLETKTPLAAIYSELGIPPLLLYTKHRQRLLGLRSLTIGRHTTWSRQWLKDSEMEEIIKFDAGISEKQGKKTIKERLRVDWTELIEGENIRYQGKPRAGYQHLRNTTRAEFRDLLYLRATAAWPYQDTDGTRRKCPCDRDVITPQHLMNSCGLIKPTKIGLYSGKRQRELLDWMSTWPEALKNRPTRRWKPDRNTAQVQGATINLPTSQTTVGPRGGKPKSRKQCDVCGFLVQRDKTAQEKHARTHEPGYKKGRKPSRAGGTAAD